MFTGRTITMVGLVKLELPGMTVRLCDGGFCTFNGEDYRSRHAQFGTIAAVEPIEEGVGDQIPGARITFAPRPGTDPAVLSSATYQNSRLRGWLGELGSDLKTVTASRSLFDGLVDTTTLIVARGTWSLEVAFMSRADKLFAINEGNTASDRFHQTVWPGEKGFENCTDTPVNVAWGVEGGSNGVYAGGGGSAPGGWGDPGLGMAYQS